MAKYILLFCILLGVFLVSGFESVSGDMKEYKELRVTGLQQGKTECNISEAGAEQCRKVVYGGEYASKAIGNIATSVSRSNIPSSQVLRFRYQIGTEDFCDCCRTIIWRKSRFR